MKSPLEVSYDEVCANPRVCEGNPLCSRPDIYGNIVLWEGQKGKSGQMFRVLKTKHNTLIFEKFAKRNNEWVKVDKLEPIRFFRGRAESGPAPGVVRIEMFLPNRIVRTIG